MRSFRAFAVPGATAFLLLTGCDVTNPGRVEEEFIATGDAQQALINGAIRMMSEGMGYGSYSAALLAKEIFPGGQIGAFGHDVTVQGGLVDAGDDLGHFDPLHQARFIGETAIKRFTEAGAPDEMMYQAHLWTGWAYRVLGEWWCEAVISNTDPDDDTPGMHELDTDTYFQRAVDNFTAALSYAADFDDDDTEDERWAALAGRAQAYLWLEQWASAEADAAAVPDDGFAFFVPYDDLDQDYFNTLYWAIAYNPYASYTMHFTWFKDYYETTGDPRTAVAENSARPLAVGSLSGYGPVEFSFPTKYASREDDQRLASGWEMRLVEAEAILAQGGPPADAMTLINAVRTRNGTNALTPWSGTTATEAWTFLKRERAIETFLEGRRLGDLRRWDEMGTPGVVDQPPGGYAAWQAISPIFVDEAERAVCFDIPNSERTANPNVPEVG